MVPQELLSILHTCPSAMIKKWARTGGRVDGLC